MCPDKIVPMDSPSQWIVLARILRPQGRRGEVLADLSTDFPERFAQHPGVWLAPAGFADGTLAPSTRNASPEPATIDAHWLPVGRNAGRIVLHFAGVDSIDKAEQLAGKEVMIPLAERMPLNPGAAYISDLIGCTVYDRGNALGIVDSVEFPTTPDGTRRLEDAAPLLAITSQTGDEILIPFANAYLVEMDLPGKTIRMSLPDGLADLNQSSAPKPE